MGYQLLGILHLLICSVSVKCCHGPIDQGDRLDKTPTLPNVIEKDVTSDHLDLYSQQSEDGSDNCTLTINQNCAMFYTNMVQDLKANFAKFQLNFKGNFTLNQTADAILPDRWVWTYFTRDGYFPYLKWPQDFKILSIGLLDMKTLPLNNEEIILDVDVIGNCSLTLGSNQTTWQLGKAFKNLTQNYLLPIHKREFGYSYWCYIKERPRIKQTLEYKLGIHLGYPVEFSRYNCCKTSSNFTDRSELNVNCIDQVPRLFRTSLFAYVASIIAFAYLPILLFTIFGQDMTPRRNHKGSYKTLEEGVQDWVFLDGKPPVSFTYLVSGLCGLGDKYPHAVSRVRRAGFLFVVPLIVYLQIYVYWKFMYDTVIAYIEHDKPLQFLSLIGGVEKSMSNYAPIFGGPFCLLVVYYVAGIMFLLLPKSLNDLVQKGSYHDSHRGHMSPLFYNEDMLVQFSGVYVQDYNGYSKAASIFRAGIYMLVNYKFWCSACSVMKKRVSRLYLYVQQMTMPLNVMCLAICIIFLPLYVILCSIEFALCILYYGVPVISCICILLKGYVRSLRSIFESSTFSEVGRLSEMIGVVIIKYSVLSLGVCLFMYFIVSISFIFTAAFNFVGQVIIMCFISAIVYPFAAFGYVFFFVILVYYILKQLERFGEGYFSLLSIAVEICSRMEDDILHARIENDTIVINKTGGAKIAKLRVHAQIINLSTELRNQIENVRCPQRQRVMYNNNTIGIPKELFDYLVEHFRPIHVQVFHAILRLSLIVALVAASISLVVIKPFGQTEELAEVLHIMFVVVIGAIPKMIEMAMDKSNHVVREDIKRSRIKALIVEYWSQKDMLK